MMQMLAAGGMPILTDGERKADDDNPRGYYEWEPIKQLPKQPALIDEAEGRAVKCISQLLLALPANRSYRIIFMERPLPEVLASQSEMIRRRGTTNAPMDDRALLKAFEGHLKQVETWLNSKAETSVLRMQYHDVLRDPLRASQSVEEFLAMPLDTTAMAAEVVPTLYRQRAQENVLPPN
jgi:hypothetical protein